MSINLRRLPTGFEVVLPSGNVLLINPVISDQTLAPVQEVTGADYIALTTHNNVRDIGTLVKRFNSRVICSHALADPLMKFFNLDFANVIRVTTGNTLVFDDLKVDVKKAEHIAMLQPIRIQYKRETGKDPSPTMSLKELIDALPSRAQRPTTPELDELVKKLSDAGIGQHGEHLNFVFHTNDNLRLYMSEAGAYDFLYHEVSQAYPHVLIAQLGRGNEPEKLAEFAAVSGAQIVIPSGYEARGEEGARRAIEAMAKHLVARSSTAQLIDLPRGTWYEIGVKMSAI